MSYNQYWNPANKNILYLHVIDEKANYYLEVNVADKRCWKLQPHTSPAERQKFYIRGFYEIRWATFIGLHWYMKPENIEWRKKNLSPEQYQKRKQIKHTTKNQFDTALKRFILDRTDELCKELSKRKFT
jgi:hypothetical protein